MYEFFKDFAGAIATTFAAIVAAVFTYYFNRAQARGMRLDIPSGTAIRFEPGQSRDIQLVPYGGTRRVVGFRGAIMGALDAPPVKGA